MSKSLVSKGLMAGVATMALAVPAMHAPIYAQDNQAAEEADDDVILVIAQKREQNLQEVPIAISAISADAVELRGISETKDLAALAPNVSVNGGTTNSTASVITIRGIPTPADESLGFDSPIGLYIDGVYLARSAASSFEVADIERVEVLRGPQGTLFGRNTTGGAVNFITKRPDDDASFKLKLGYGNYNRMEARGILNSGLIAEGNTKMTLGFLHRKRDGVVDNLLQPDDGLDPGGSEVSSARWAVESDFSDNFNFYNVFDWTRIEGVPFANQLTGVGDGTFRPNVTINGNTFAQVQPANVAGYLAAATALEPQCGTPLSNVQRARLDPICLESAGTAIDRIWGNLTRMELDIGDITVRSSTSFRRWRNRINGSDLDGLGTISGPLFSQASTLNGMPANLIAFTLPPAQQPFAPFIAAAPIPQTTQPLFQAENDRRQNQFSQELEIIGGSGTAFEWVVGGFYFRETGNESNLQNFAFVLDTNQAVFSDANFGAFLGPQFRAANPAQFRAVAQTSTLAYSVRARSFAIYGQGTYRPGGEDGALGITVGLRYTWDKKEIDRSQNGATPFATAADITLNQQEVSFSEPTGHITLDYRAADDINLYARAARGYRSGGFNARQTTSAANNIGLIPFGEEKITSYELGWKTRFADAVTLNGAVFYNIYEDQQVTVPIPIAGGGSFGTQVVNAGKTRYYGIELEGRVHLSEQFSLDGAVGYIKRDVAEFPAADINGNLQNIADVVRSGNSPSTTANIGVNYQSYLGGDTRLTARVGWSYVAGQDFFPNPLSAPFLTDIRASSRSLFDAQLRIDEIDLGGSQLGITLWGKNLTDDEYISRGIDFGQLGFGSAIYGQPRTYGISAEITF